MESGTSLPLRSGMVIEWRLFRAYSFILDGFRHPVRSMRSASSDNTQHFHLLLPVSISRNMLSLEPLTLPWCQD